MEAQSLKDSGPYAICTAGTQQRTDKASHVLDEAEKWAGIFTIKNRDQVLFIKRSDAAILLYGNGFSALLPHLALIGVQCTTRSGPEVATQ